MTPKRCFSCEQTEQDMPILPLHFAGNQIAICPQCLPTLIHQPTRLVDKLPGLKPPPPAASGHH